MYDSLALVLGNGSENRRPVREGLARINDAGLTVPAALMRTENAIRNFCGEPLIIAGGALTSQLTTLEVVSRSRLSVRCHEGIDPSRAHSHCC